MGTVDKVNAARQFVRSLNTLVKSVRLYGPEHSTVANQHGTTWKQLRSIVPAPGEAPVVLGVSGSELLLDGTPLGDSPVEKGFAKLLATGGLSSIQFESRVTEEGFKQFVSVLAAAGNQSKDLAKELQAGLAKSRESGIRINEVRFVPEDAALAEARLSAGLAVGVMGMAPEQLHQALNDPKKLLGFMLAAEGARSEAGAGAGGGAPSGALPAAEGVAAAAGAVPGAGLGPASAGGGINLQEEEVANLLRLLSRMGKGLQPDETTSAMGQFHEELASMPSDSKATLQQALAGLAATAPPASSSGEPMLLRLAEHLAIRFALERYQRGEVQVNAVRELLDRMSREIVTLRQQTSSAGAGAAAADTSSESYLEFLDNQFWSAVPAEQKRLLLDSSEAWCIPPQEVRHFIEQLVEDSQDVQAAELLMNYAAPIRSLNPEAREKTARGVSVLAGLYARGYTEVLDTVMRNLHDQLAVEPLPEVQRLLSEAFLHLSQEVGAVTQPPLPSATLFCQGCGSQQLSVPLRESLAERLRNQEVNLYCPKCEACTRWSDTQPEGLAEEAAPESAPPKGPPDGVERREERRVRIKLPIRIRCESPELTFTEENHTANISRHGVLFHCTHLLREDMELYVLVPYNKGEDVPETRARILRVRKYKDHYVVAVHLES